MAEGDREPGGRGAKFTILYVEDSAVNFKFVEMVFAVDADVEVVQADSAADGLEFARSCHAGLILLDLHLPDASGTEVLERLKSDSATSAIPVVAVSADARRSQAEQVIAAGAEDYLTKPIAVGKLMDVVARLRRQVA